MKKGKHTYELSLWNETILLRAGDSDRMASYEWSTLRHNNADYELHIVLRGACFLDVEARTYELHRGQAVLLAPGHYHRPQTHPGDFERISMNFAISQGRLLKTLQNRVPVCEVLDLPDSLLVHCRNLIYEGAAGNAFRQEMMQAMLMQLMVSILRLFGLADAPQAASPSPDEVDRTGLIDAFFERHMADRAGEALLAERLHLSKRQLARVLLEHYDMNFRQKLLVTRMDHAGWLLRTTEKSIGEICSIVGYNSETTFFKNFKNHYDVTPLQYRKQHQSKDI